MHAKGEPAGSVSKYPMLGFEHQKQHCHLFHINTTWNLEKKNPILQEISFCEFFNIGIEPNTDVTLGSDVWLRQLVQTRSSCVTA